MDNLDRYIENQKRVEPSVYLVSKIIGRANSEVEQKLSLWQRVAMSASVAAVVMLGVFIGSLYDAGSTITIDDSEIENFVILASNDYE